MIVNLDILALSYRIQTRYDDPCRKHSNFIIQKVCTSILNMSIHLYLCLFWTLSVVVSVYTFVQFVTPWLFIYLLLFSRHLNFVVLQGSTPINNSICFLFLQIFISCQPQNLTFIYNSLSNICIPFIDIFLLHQRAQNGDSYKNWISKIKLRLIVIFLRGSGKTYM